RDVTVHLDNLVCTTGISHFGELSGQIDHPRSAGAAVKVRYSKIENLGISDFQTHSLRFDYLVNEHAQIPGFENVKAVKGFAGLALTRVVKVFGPVPFLGRLPFIKADQKEMLFIHKRI